MINKQMLAEVKEILLIKTEASPENDKLQEFYTAVEKQQLQLKRQIILAYMIEKYAIMSGSKPASYYAKGWRESAVFILTGEILDEWRLDVANAERMVDMKKAIEAIEESIENGLSLIHEIAKP